MNWDSHTSAIKGVEVGLSRIISPLESNLTRLRKNIDEVIGWS